MVAAAVSFYPALYAPRRARELVLVAVLAVLLAGPWLIPADARLARCVAAVMAVTLAVKLWDLHVGAARGDRPGAGGFLAFLPNIFGLVHRRLDAEPRPAAGRDLRRLAGAAAVCGPMAVLFVACFAVEWRRYGFAAEHTAKVVCFFLALVPLTAVLAAGWRLAGGRAREFMDNPFAARTPADFWRRYNRPVNQFMHEDVFLPAGGRRHPVRATVAVFLVSAFVHEYVFAAAVGRVQGYQTLFFLLQGVAVAATLRVRPRGPAAVATVAATFAFNVATAVFFFASVNGVVPFYENRVPLWEQGPAVGPAVGSPAATWVPRAIALGLVGVEARLGREWRAVEQPDRVQLFRRRQQCHVRDSLVRRQPHDAVSEVQLFVALHERARTGDDAAHFVPPLRRRDPQVDVVARAEQAKSAPAEGKPFEQVHPASLGLTEPELRHCVPGPGRVVESGRVGSSKCTTRPRPRRRGRRPPPRRPAPRPGAPRLAKSRAAR